MIKQKENSKMGKTNDTILNSRGVRAKSAEESTAGVRGKYVGGHGTGNQQNGQWDDNKKKTDIEEEVADAESDIRGESGKKSYINEPQYFDGKNSGGRTSYSDDYDDDSTETDDDIYYDYESDDYPDNNEILRYEL